MAMVALMPLGELKETNGADISLFPMLAEKSRLPVSYIYKELVGAVVILGFVGRDRPTMEIPRKRDINTTRLTRLIEKAFTEMVVGIMKVCLNDEMI